MPCSRLRQSTQFIWLGLLLQCVWSENPVRNTSNLPVVLWHGMGASAGQIGGTSLIKKYLQDQLGVYVLSISSGPDAEEVYSGFFGHINNQVDAACKVIAQKVELQQGYNALGLSQGGLFLRALAERCNKGPKMRTLITLGAPHQGVINVPVCTGLPGQSSWSPVYWACRGMQKALEVGAYVPWIQNSVIQAQYYRDPDDNKAYLTKNTFLPAINNDGGHRNETYRDNIVGLEQLILMRFASDVTVVPKDSAWFSIATGNSLIPLHETTLYKEDLIGLKELERNGRLVLDSLPGVHMQFSLAELDERIIQPYLKSKNIQDTVKS